MDVTPAAGGRIALLASAGEGGRRVDWLAPMSAESLRNGFEGLVWPKAGCYPLLPFSNRIRDGRFEWGGREIRLAPHPGQTHAVYGLVHVRAWTAEQMTASSIKLGLRYVLEADSWPWPFTATQTLVLTESGLDAVMTLHDDGDSSMPAGGGFRPYFTRTADTHMQFDAATMWPADADGVAVRRGPITPREDFRHTRALPDAALSVYYSEWQQRAVVSRAGGELTLSADDPLDHFILHAPNAQPYFCLKPISHAADAINLAAQEWEGTGLRALAPGETLHTRMQLRTETVAWNAAPAPASGGAEQFRLVGRYSNRGQQGSPGRSGHVQYATYRILASTRAHRCASVIPANSYEVLRVLVFAAGRLLKRFAGH